MCFRGKKSERQFLNDEKSIEKEEHIWDKRKTKNADSFAKRFDPLFLDRHYKLEFKKNLTKDSKSYFSVTCGLNGGCTERQTLDMELL